MHTELMTERLESAFRWASDRHRGQTRRGSDTPYFEHVAKTVVFYFSG